MGKKRAYIIFSYNIKYQNTHLEQQDDFSVFGIATNYIEFKKTSRSKSGKNVTIRPYIPPGNIVKLDLADTRHEPLTLKVWTTVRKLH